MTLQSVAARIRGLAKDADDPTLDGLITATRMFESDPEFTAPERLKVALIENEQLKAKLERVRVLADEYANEYDPDGMNPRLARRLREALGEKG